jgi:hypothetical protein
MVEAFEVFGAHLPAGPRTRHRCHGRHVRGAAYSGRWICCGPPSGPRTGGPQRMRRPPHPSGIPPRTALVPPPRARRYALAVVAPQAPLQVCVSRPAPVQDRPLHSQDKTMPQEAILLVPICTCSPGVDEIHTLLDPALAAVSSFLLPFALPRPHFHPFLRWLSLGDQSAWRNSVLTSSHQLQSRGTGMWVTHQAYQQGPPGSDLAGGTPAAARPARGPARRADRSAPSAD